MHHHLARQSSANTTADACDDADSCHNVTDDIHADHVFYQFGSGDRNQDLVTVTVTAQAGSGTGTLA
jgi:hypothetical protein